jgi:hypothetical protein
MGTKNSFRTLKASQTGWIALDQRVLHVKPSPAEHWSLIGGTGPRASVAVRTLNYWGQGSEQVRSAALKLQRYAVPIEFLHKLHCQVEVMQDEPDLALAHAASISLARIYRIGLCCVRKSLRDSRCELLNCKVTVVPWYFNR